MLHPKFLTLFAPDFETGVVHVHADENVPPAPGSSFWEMPAQTYVVAMLAVPTALLVVGGIAQIVAMANKKPVRRRVRWPFPVKLVCCEN